MWIPASCVVKLFFFPPPVIKVDAVQCKRWWLHTTFANWFFFFFLAKHIVLSPDTSVKYRQPSALPLNVSEENGSLFCSYKIVCVNTGRARPRPPGYFSTPNTCSLVRPVRIWLLLQGAPCCWGGFFFFFKARGGVSVGGRLLMDGRWLLLSTGLPPPLCQTNFCTTTASCHSCSPLWPPCTPLFPSSRSLNAPPPPLHKNHSGCSQCWRGPRHVPPVRRSPRCRPVPVLTTVTEVGDPVFLYKCILTVTLWRM